MTKIYNAPKTLAEYIGLDSRVQLLLGPIGGGKTTGVLMKVLAIAHNQRPNAVGERKTRFACVRNTRPQLRDSVLKTVFDWLPPDGKLIDWRETDMTLVLSLPQPDGTIVKSEIMFRALDDAADARRLLSVEFTAVWFSEFREIPHALLKDALSRCGRFPSAADGGCTWHGLLAESNMPIRGSDWYDYMEVNRPSYCSVLKQPSGVGPEAENIENLPADYYQTLMEGTTHEWRQAHIFVEYPDSLDGKAVFGNTFFRDRHVALTPLRPMRFGTDSPTLLIGVDQGRSPAAVFAQRDGRTRLNVLDELSVSGMGMTKFAVEYLRPLVTERYLGVPVMVVLDPAGFRKTEVGEESPADVLRKLGFRVVPAPTNDPDRRIEAVERLLLKADGLLIDQRCKQLIGAMSNEYRYKVKKNGNLEDRPEKLHPWSDLADCLQYIALIAGGEHYGRIVTAAMSQGVSRIPSEKAPNPRGWC